MRKPMSLRLRVTLLCAALLTLCCLLLTVTNNFSAIRMADAIQAVPLLPAQRAELVRAASYFDQFEKSDRRHVSPDLVEAAQIDGATSRQILFKIKLPMIMPSVTICTFLTLTNGFKMFDQNLSLTGGDPGKQSQLLALNIYDTFYGRSGPAWKGIGQAKAVVFFVLVVAIALIQLRATSSKEVQA